MEPDINWRKAMLNNLYKKLYVVFAFSVMLIISFVTVFAVMTSVRSERENEGVMFQRLTTLMIYQLENSHTDMERAIRAYEKEYDISVRLENGAGREIYQSDIGFPTGTEILLEELKKQEASQQTFSKEKGEPFTSQGGICEIAGKENDRYYAITASIVTADGEEFRGIFITHIPDTGVVLSRTIPRYLLIWAVSLAGVLVLTRLLLKKAFMPTERVLKSQRDFVAAASHELKAPLAVMMANAESLLDDAPLNGAARQSAGVIEAECMRLSRLVNDMLLLASSDAKAWKSHKSIVDVDTLLITLYETYEQTCIKNGMQLKLNLSDNAYPSLYTDRDRLFQILCVFMDNAIQHSGDNSLIEIQAGYTKQEIAFSVADHGAGISDEDKKYIFDRFFSGDRAHANKANFGLGLSIAEELTKMLNGTIRVGDTDGGGATFTAAFPLKKYNNKNRGVYHNEL